MIFGVLRHHGGRIAEENRPLPGVRVDAPVVDPRRGHLHRARAGEDLPRLMAAVAHHQAAAPLVALGAEPGDVGINLGLQRLGQHPPRALPHDVIDQRRRAVLAALVAEPSLRDYREHGSYLPDRRSSAGLCLRLDSVIGKVHPFRLIHRSQALLWSSRNRAC